MSEGTAKGVPPMSTAAAGRLRRRNRWLGVIFLLFVLGIIVMSFVIFSYHGFPPRW